MASPDLDLKNVQGDILLGGLPKKTETFFFFRIKDDGVKEFRKQLAQLEPLITSSFHVAHDRERIHDYKKGLAGTMGGAQKPITPHLLEMSGVNIAFSHKGLLKMGISDEIGDTAFDRGMLSDAPSLKDNVDTDWVSEFKQEIHGVILVTGDSHLTVDYKLAKIKKIFLVGEGHATVQEVISIVGDTRRGNESGHEHFGFLDGVSQPAVKGVDTTPLPGQETVPQGIILLGREGDAPDVPLATRPAWAQDGSFLCFRYLFQLVPEFDRFLIEHPLPGAPPDLASELLGARLVGRWKSGAPIDITPLKDDKSLGRDPNRNDNFRYDPTSQERCPFAAHTRKTNPRSDLDPFGGTTTRRILRRGIQFGPEVTAEERQSHRTTKGRGLLFVSYQSVINHGFRFIQETWANNVGFPFKKPQQPGLDTIIGQTDDPSVRAMSGTNPGDLSQSLTTQQWVVAKGGEYFFSPSISALRDKFVVRT